MEKIRGRSFPLWATILLLVTVIPVTAFIVGQVATNTITASATVAWAPYLWIDFDDSEPFPTSPSLGVNESFGIIVTFNTSTRARTDHLYITYVINVTNSGGSISTGSLNIFADVLGNIDAMSKTLLGDGTLQFTFDPLNDAQYPWVWNYGGYYSIDSHGFVLNFEEAGNYNFKIYAVTRGP